MVSPQLYLFCSQQWLLSAGRELKGYRRVMKCFRIMVFSPFHWAAVRWCEGYRPPVISVQFFSWIFTDCVGATAASITVTNVSDDDVTLPLPQRQWFPGPGRCVFKIFCIALQALCSRTVRASRASLTIHRTYGYRNK